MIEYLHDAIRASANEDIEITAILTDGLGLPIAEECYFNLFLEQGGGPLITVPGTFIEELGTWEFTVPAAEIKGMEGRYWYSISHENESLSFKQPIYLRG